MIIIIVITAFMLLLDQTVTVLVPGNPGIFEEQVVYKYPSFKMQNEYLNKWNSSFQSVTLPLPSPPFLNDIGFILVCFLEYRNPVEFR